MNANAAKQRKERARLRGSVIFILFVILTGLVLTATHHTEDPIANMSDIIDMRQMLADAKQSSEVTVGDAPLGNDPTSVPANSIRNAGITWSALGEVVYDLWFMCAATAAVIVCSYLLKWLKGLSGVKRLPPSAVVQPTRRQRPPTV